MQEKSSRRQADRRAETRAALLNAARRLFAARGFAGVGAPEIAEAAGVTRGAITHHFTDKAGLFEAVVRAEAQAVADALSGLPPGEGAVMRGARRWFQAMRDPGRVRLMLVDGPAVLGAARMAQIDTETGGGQLAEGLAQELPGADAAQTAALAEILSAGFDRAALRISQGAEEQPFLTAMEGLIERLR